MWNRALSIPQVADLIARFLGRKETYPQEWNDFIEIHQEKAAVEIVRKRCYELDPYVNRPGAQNEEALAELNFIVALLYEIAHERDT